MADLGVRGRYKIYPLWFQEEQAASAIVEKKRLHNGRRDDLLVEAQPSILPAVYRLPR